MKKNNLDSTVPNPSSLSLDKLRSLRKELQAKEIQVSYWRRLIHSRIDMMFSSNTDVDSLVDALVKNMEHPTRLQALTFDLPEVKDNEKDYSQVALGNIDPMYEQKLLETERKLSLERIRIHSDLEALNRELVKRYRKSPRLALTALREQFPSMQF